MKHTNPVGLSSNPAGPSPNPSPAGRGVVCEVTPTGLLVWGRYVFFLSRWGGLSFTLDILFSHRTHRLNRTYLRTVSIPQNASGIQISQNVKAIVDTNKGQHEAYILLIGVSR